MIIGNGPDVCFLIGEKRYGEYFKGQQRDEANLFRR